MIRQGYAAVSAFLLLSDRSVLETNNRAACQGHVSGMHPSALLSALETLPVKQPRTSATFSNSK